jgi:hypothetical protein
LQVLTVEKRTGMGKLMVLEKRLQINDFGALKG